MKTKKQLIKTVVRTIKSILATVLLLTCIEYFPTVASAECEDAGTANETISEYGSTELAEAAEQSQEGSTITVDQPQQEEQASEPAQEQQEEVPADIQQQNIEQPSNTEDNSLENNSEQTLVQNDENKEVSGVNVGRYNMGLTADCFEVKSDVYSNIKLVVTDGYLDIKAKD